MTDLDLVSTFLEAQAAELDAAENTQLAYARDLKDFHGWLGGRSLALLGAEQPDIEAYLVTLDHNGAEHWVPKTLCELKGSVLEVENWFAQKERMNDE